MNAKDCLFASLWERSHMMSARFRSFSPPSPMSAFNDPPNDVRICQTPAQFEIDISSIFEGNLEKSPHINCEVE